jgi:1-acyl-sn-glycerol-3-phosphate acyltransferase
VNGLRSALFGICFYAVSTPLAILYAVLLLAPRKAIMRGMRVWAQLAIVGLRVIAGVKVEARGLEHRPQGAALVAAKHQCMLDFIVPLALLPDACFVLKKELMLIPFFGWIAAKSRMIPIDREARSKALKDMLRAARDRMTDPRQIVIFPKGTRQKPGAAPDYKPGVAALYRELGLPCAPVATNSGVHWAKGFPGKPGTVVFEFLPAIPPGLKRDAFMTQLQAEIETASDALLAAGL